VLTPELHETDTVDASAVPTVGTWKLRITDGTPEIFDLEPGHLQRWSLTLRGSGATVVTGVRPGRGRNGHRLVTRGCDPRRSCGGR
jgi:hypothetical protein